MLLVLEALLLGKHQLLVRPLGSELGVRGVKILSLGCWISLWRGLLWVILEEGGVKRGRRDVRCPGADWLLLNEACLLLGEQHLLLLGREHLLLVLLLLEHLLLLMLLLLLLCVALALLVSGG